MSVKATVAALSVAVALGGGIVACGDDDGEADTLRVELAEVSAERDQLQARIDADDERHDKSVATMKAIRAILDDPTSYGSEDEVVDLLASYASDGAQMRDDALGDVGIQSAWYNTLYGGAVDAEIEIVHQWFAPDGSQSGTLWVWRGTNLVDNPFELIGVSIDTHDDDGRITDEWVIYPYPDEYVEAAFRRGGTAISEIWSD